MLGDRYGMAASPMLVRYAERVFEAQGLRSRAQRALRRRLHHASARPAVARRVHALQIEINRALYLDEERIEPSPRYESLRTRLAAAIEALVGIDRALLRPPGARDVPLAAE